MRKKAAFTLIEIMIVVAVVVLLSAISIPNLFRARMNAIEFAALGSIRAISSAAQQYRVANRVYPDELLFLGPGAAGGAAGGGGAVGYCAAIAQSGYLDANLGCLVDPCLKNGYLFAIFGSTNTFSAAAIPEDYWTWGRWAKRFFVDESGVIRYTTVGYYRHSNLSTLNTIPIDY